MRFTPDVRKLMRDLVLKGRSKAAIARFLGTARSTVYRWFKRPQHAGREYYNDRSRKPKESKVTVDVEVSILALRNTFSWGTARIQQGLYALPGYMIKAVNCVQGVRLSRKTINDVLKKHGINGFRREQKAWKFFRAKEPDELWQIDLKGPYTVQGRKYWFLVCIDDYSRYLLLADQLDHCPSTKEITARLETLARRPKGILTDNGGQFKEQWKGWCTSRGIIPHFAHPYYPQDKGKVERAIRNVSEEFAYQLRRFTGWLDGKMEEYLTWFNKSRFHRGIKGYPAGLYECNVGKLTYSSPNK